MIHLNLYEPIRFSPHPDFMIERLGEILSSIAKGFLEGQGSFSIAFAVWGYVRPPFLFPSFGMGVVSF
jgi:hypothetical protein